MIESEHKSKLREFFIGSYKATEMWDNNKEFEDKDRMLDVYHRDDHGVITGCGILAFLTMEAGKY